MTAGSVSWAHSAVTDRRWKQLAQQEEWLAELDAKIEQQTRPFVDELEGLDAVPGVDRRVLQVWLAEVGADMSPFPHDENLASWAGACAGNDVSAGKRKRRRFTPGNPWLKQAAWGASRTKNSYLAAQSWLVGEVRNAP